ncbi:MAG TPA: hypothetical protein VG778_01595 [Blastocatellia bacterium]|jgi:hypothetical protein|nr:hypothetical protein [Blastocatellia bacterium]
MSETGRERHGAAKQLDEIDLEIEELRRSIRATRTHGIFYYLLLVAIILLGFAIGYATHSLVGAVIILFGLALVAWREVTGFRARTGVLSHLLADKMAERRHLEERQKEYEIER